MNPHVDTFYSKIPNLSEPELLAYIHNYSQYRAEAVQAAIKECKSRGYHLTKDELFEIENYFISQTKQNDLTLDSVSNKFSIPISRVLFICGFGLVVYAGFLFAHDQTYWGIKYLGLSLIVLGGSFDSLNFLWLCLPFTDKKVVHSTAYARIGNPLLIIGVFLYFVGRIWKLFFT